MRLCGNRRRKYIKPKELKPISGQDAFNEAIDWLLGEDWYCVDPIHTWQVNAVALEEIKMKYKSANKKGKRED